MPNFFPMVSHSLGAGCFPCSVCACVCGSSRLFTALPLHHHFEDNAFRESVDGVGTTTTTQMNGGVLIFRGNHFILFQNFNTQTDSHSTLAVTAIWGIA